MQNQATVKRVHLSPDPASIKTPGERAIMEVMLELCDDNLDVECTQMEVRELTEIYWDVYKAEPFIGLRELIEADPGVELFFDMFRSEVLPVREVIARRKKVLEMYKKFISASAGLEQTVHLQALRTHTYQLVLFDLNYRMALQKPKPKKVWIQ